MRKAFIGVSVVAVFIIYSYVVRHNHSKAIIAPASISKSNTSTTNTPASSTSSNTSSQTATSNTTQTASAYKDGTYNGSVDNAYYGNVQVAAVVKGGKITAVNVLQSPNENPNSIYINSQALPYLKQETIKAQSAKIDAISGATLTSQAFIQSITDALSQAK
jgi:uncharacterized protein with FMN-binding domain